MSPLDNGDKGALLESSLSKANAGPRGTSGEREQEKITFSSGSKEEIYGRALTRPRPLSSCSRADGEALCLKVTKETIVRPEQDFTTDDIGQGEQQSRAKQWTSVLADADLGLGSHMVLTWQVHTPARDQASASVLMAVPPLDLQGVEQQKHLFFRCYRGTGQLAGRQAQRHLYGRSEPGIHSRLATTWGTPQHSPVPLGPARHVSPAALGKPSSLPTEGVTGPEPPLLLAAASHAVVALLPGRPDTRAPGFNSLPGLASAVPRFQERSRGPEIHVAARPQPPPSPRCGSHGDGPEVRLVYVDNRRSHGSR
ncbi:hypothetical protein NDU88_011797 [Pleurodeles waltl]|uniref:Uncharacterized protein n=1 Tax=Pleurodeles waltl TaxID=8319 RepID=A0AAV7R2E6_PLEWA|nr:hypothetical protein NDU88_011797 [Pleurodeles waltl]